MADDERPPIDEIGDEAWAFLTEGNTRDGYVDPITWYARKLRNTFVNGTHNLDLGREPRTVLARVTAELSALQSVRSTEAGAAPTMRTLAEQRANPRAEPESIIDGLLREGDVAVVGAPRGLGKSYLAMQLAFDLALGGVHFLGTWLVPKARNVLYCSGELGEWAMGTRWSKMETAYTHRVPDARVRTLYSEDFPWRLDVLTERLYLGGEPGEQLVREKVVAEFPEWLEAAILAGEIGLVILDPWASIFGGNENSNRETEAVMGKLHALARRSGCAIVIVHHLSKAGAMLGASKLHEPEDLWRGATRLADSAGTRLTLLPYAVDGDNGDRHSRRRRCLVSVLTRAYAPVDDFHVERDTLTGYWRPYMPEAVSRGTGTVAQRWTPADVAEALRAEDGHCWPSLRAAARALGYSGDATNAEPVLDQAIRAGVIRESRTGSGPRRFRLVEDELPDVEA